MKNVPLISGATSAAGAAATVATRAKRTAEMENCILVGGKDERG